MNARNRPDRTLSRGDGLALVLLAVAGAAIAAWAVVEAVLRIIEALRNTDVPVLAVFNGTPGVAPLGVDGTGVPVLLEQAYVTVPALQPAAVGALVIQQVIGAGAIVTVVVCLLLVAVSGLRGRVFSRRNTVLVSGAGIAALLGVALHPFFGNMAANGAFALLSERTFDNVIISVDISTLLLIAFMSGLLSTVFATGDRLQRDTEGLV